MAGGGCEHNEACLHWIPDIKMWERRCPCGLNAYGMTLPDLDRVWRRNANNEKGEHMKTVEVSDEIHARLEEIVERGRRNYPGYGHLTQSADELAGKYLEGAIRNYDEMRRVGELPFTPLHGR